MSDVGQVGLLCVAGPMQVVRLFVLFYTVLCPVQYVLFTVYWHNTSGSFCTLLCCFVTQGKLKAVEPAKEQQGEKK